MQAKHKYYYLLKYKVNGKQVEIPFATKETAQFCLNDLKRDNIIAELIKVENIIK